MLLSCRSEYPWETEIASNQRKIGFLTDVLRHSLGIGLFQAAL
jgi:hypothetical protein